MLFCCCSQCKVLEIRYEWINSSSRDLDTGTTFLGNKVGWACGSGSQYMIWSGDSVGSSSVETVKIEIKRALEDKAWSKSTTIQLAAGWYIPARGSGPAKIWASCKKGIYDTIPVGKYQTIDISPGQQRNCASTPVGSIVVSERNGSITFKLNSNPLP